MMKWEGQDGTRHGVSLFIPYRVVGQLWDGLLKEILIASYVIHAANKLRLVRI